jgi:peptidoglycan/LPS O-acetylase OafA/YrhL
MKPLALIYLVFVAAMAFGIALGLSGWQSASLMAKVDVAVAVFFGGMLLFIWWRWSRTNPNSPDQKFMSTMMMLSASLLLGAMPRIVWPEGGWPRTAASLLALGSTVVFLIQLRRQRSKSAVG